MTTIRELKQKGRELKQRVEKFGAPLGNKNAAGPHDGIPGNSRVADIAVKIKKIKQEINRTLPNTALKKARIGLLKDRWAVLQKELDNINQDLRFKSGMDKMKTAFKEDYKKPSQKLPSGWFPGRV